VQADLDDGLPAEVIAGEPFDLILAADVLEHVRDPKTVLADLHHVLDPAGRLLVSVPNFGHWYPRLRVLSGSFDYDRRGILDAGHLRFFTRRSFDRLIDISGLDIVRRGVVGLPIEALERGSGRPSGVGRLVAAVDRKAADQWPTLFGYQFLYELRTTRIGDV
jgi:SAM-dependent methyltransferase